MQIFPSLAEFLQARQALSPQVSVGLVPTMGALHEGHASLLRRSVVENEISIATIFVNPTQFGPQEDLSRYPRTFEADVALLKSLGVDWLLAPNQDEIYPKEAPFIAFQIRELADKLCGAKRPGHFQGVLQIVSILFHLTRPTRAYFGSKDYQQLLLIRKLAAELHFQLSVIACPIVREADGLAMSSRNRYLNPTERQMAIGLSQALFQLKTAAPQLRSIEEALALLHACLKDYSQVVPDYVEILRGDTLEPLSTLNPDEQPHAFIAAYLGKTRLIDNMALF